MTFSSIIPSTSSEHYKILLSCRINTAKNFNVIAPCRVRCFYFWPSHLFLSKNTFRWLLP